MTVRSTDDARLANLRAALASISARAEADIDARSQFALDTLKLIRDAAEAALKADEREGGKLDG